MSKKPAEVSNTTNPWVKERVDAFRDRLRRAILAWPRKVDDRKLQVLCERYGIPDGPDMYRELSLCLARDYAPEFKTPKRKGRNRKWSPILKGALVVEMERTIKADDPAHGVAWAAKQLSKREPWKALEGECTDPAEVLRRTYYEARGARDTEVARYYFEKHRQVGSFGLWDSVNVDNLKEPPNP